MSIEITGLAGEPRLRAHIVKRMREALAHLTVAPVSAHVGFFDDNGPKGGVDSRCAVTVALPYRPRVRVENVAEAPRQAFDLSFDALERQLQRYGERQRESRRRPKKYFAAKRLLASEGPTIRSRSR